MTYADGDDNFIPDEHSSDVIRFSVYDGQEIPAAFKHVGEAPAKFFQQVFIGIVDDFKLIGKEYDARGVSIVQSDLGCIGKHDSDYTKPLTNTKKIVLCLLLRFWRHFSV